MEEEDITMLPEEREALYRELFARTLDAILVADEQGRWLDVNEGALALLGYRRDDLLAADVAGVVVAGDRWIGDVLGADGEWRGDVELRRNDGITVHAEGRALVLRDAMPRLIAVVLRQPASRRPGSLVEAEFSAIVEGSYDAIFSKTLDGVIRSWNPGAERIYGYTPEEVIGRHVSMLAPPDRKHEITEIMDRLRRGERVRDLRTKRVTRAGEVVDIWLSISPVRDPDGHIVGAATIARDITDHVRIEEELRTARDQLSIITRASADGLTIQDASGRVVYANDASARLSGYPDAASFLSAPVDEVLARFELFDEEGQPVASDRLPGRRVLSGEPQAEAMLRVRDVEAGVETWRLVRASPLLDEHARVRYVVNVFHDVTAQKRAKEQLRFQAVLLETQAEASDEGILIVSTRGDVISTNRRFAEMWRVPDELAQGDASEGILAHLAAALVDPDTLMGSIGSRWDDPREARDDLLLRDGRTFERYTKPLQDAGERLYGRIVFFRDVTEERRREGRQRFVAEASRELMVTLDYEGTISRIAQMAVPALADWCAVDIVERGGSVRQLAVAHLDPTTIEWAKAFPERFRVDLDAQQGIGAVVRTGRPELYPVVSPDMTDAVARTPEQLEAIRALRMHSLMIVPLIARGRTLGAMTFVCAESGRSYDEADLRLAEDIAARAALALDNARLYRERDRVANTLQQSMLPGPLPEIAGLELSARYRAAGEGIDVGGDFYDVFESGADTWSFVIGDVCGKGPTAATLASAARYTVRTAAMRSRRPSNVLRTLNAALQRHVEEPWFCTVCYARLRRTQDGIRLTVSSGGHPLPIVLRGDGSIESVGRPGTLLGVFDHVDVADVVVDLRPGDTIVFFTDGVTDERRDGVAFGDERLVQVIRDAAGRSTDELAEAIESAVCAFAEEPTDDIALLIARVVSPT
jgi:PAS domain S-box-containing protein